MSADRIRFPAFLTRLVQETRARAATKSVRETSAAEAWNGDTTKTTIDADDNRHDPITASWLAYTRSFSSDRKSFPRLIASRGEKNFNKNEYIISKMLERDS